ncbi:MFS general substrate transporter [Rhizodiscina lignyota]|uniref:MFS general substrate transporter n=1 Tax=Rhizodiscina lignyota TaxID=1504668 RepID=A0A9P4IKR8_9PEZI|nr:MFS general substrate transporter [Rhizodiscina lignyota]
MSFTTTTFGAFVDIESQPEEITLPSPVVQKAAATPTAIELDELTWGKRYNGPHPPSAGPASPTEERSQFTGQRAQTPNPLIASEPTTPQADTAAELIQSFFHPSMNKWRVFGGCLVYCVNGLTDSAAGALIPYIEKDFHIGYAVVSTIFVSQAVGFITSAFFVDTLISRFGRAKTLIISELTLILAYVLLVCTPPFGVVVLSYLFLGLGMAINIALYNVFCSNLAQSTVVLGASHGSYGVGGICGPIIATALVSRGVVWSRYWFITLGLRVLCVFAVAITFWGYEKEGPARLQLALERTASRRTAMEAGQSSKRQVLWQAFKNRTTLLGALFIFAYQGAEVSISGWVISFLISYRHGIPSQVGYVTAGFWGGITAGRFLLTPLCHRVGEKRSVFFLTVGAAAFEFLVWFIPNVIGPSVAVAFVGLLLGPVYPCGQTIFSRLLSKRLQTTSVGFISGAGSSGGAVAPFLTGLLAGVSGTWVLHPVCIGLFGVMLGSWFLLPKVEKRDE